jgi:hypothetical protein
VTYYWTFRRKAALVCDVEAGRAPLAEVLAAHEISPEEFASWQAAFARGGDRALRATRIMPKHARQGMRDVGGGESRL